MSDLLQGAANCLTETLLVAYLVDELEVRHENGRARTGEGELEDGAILFGEIEESINGKLWQC